MRKMVSVATVVMAMLLSGCGEKVAPDATGTEAASAVTETGSADGVKVVTTLFPLFDFTRQVGGDKVNVRLILPPGVEPHRFDPSPRDIVAISKADIFIYTGEAMEPWARRVQRSLDKSILVVDASKGISLAAPASGGEQAEGKHSHDDHHVCATCSGSDADPHIWLDFNRAQIMVDNVLNGLVARDPDNSAYYTANAKACKEKLQELDERTRKALAACEHKTIYSGGHFAFSYFVSRYGLKHVSPYEGFSPDAEPSPQAIGALVQSIRKSGAKAIFFEEMLEPSVAKVISEETGAKLLLLHAAHNLSKDELERGETYLSIMEGNLKRLKEGLNWQETNVQP